MMVVTLLLLVEVPEQVRQSLSLAIDHLVAYSTGVDFGNYFTLFDLNGVK